MAKHWQDKSQWITHCPICFCAVTHQLYDFHMQYHEKIIPVNQNNTTDGIIDT